MNPTLIETVSRTDQGLVRKNNQDSLALFPELGLVIVADGMGGHDAGEVASRLATETAANCLITDEALAIEEPQMVAAVSAANSTVVDNAGQVPEWRGMGTTLLLGSFQRGRVCYAHVGDSRLYRFRADRLECLTEDHTLIQQLVNDGVFSSIEEAREAGVRSNSLVRGVGIEAGVKADVATAQIEEGDLFLFCSDGLSNMVPDALIASTISASAGDINTAADRLLAVALANGGKDNISLVLVLVCSEK